VTAISYWWSFGTKPLAYPNGFRNVQINGECDALVDMTLNDL